VPIVLRVASRLPPRRRAVAKTGVAALAAAATLLYGNAANAQLSAALHEKKNVVKFSHNNNQFLDAPLQQPLGQGDYVVTGARSLAGILYSDKTYLRINESTKVLITVGTRQRDVTMPDKNSALYGNFHGPGRAAGQRALCAVRGTELEFLVEANRDVVRCFGPQGHQVLVTSIDNALITGHVTTPGAAVFSSDDLVGNTENWIGAKLEFLTGGDRRQIRTVTNFDPVTGAVTLNAPVTDANNLNAWFYMLNPPAARVVILEKNMETYVPHIVGAVPVDPYPTEPKEFAGGDALAFMNEPLHGDQQSHLTGFFHDRTRQSYYELDNARDASQSYGEEAPGIQILSPKGSRNEPPGTGDLGVGVGSSNGPGSGNLGVGIGNGNPNGNGGLVVNIGRASRAIFPRKPEIGAVGYSTTGSDSGLFYANDAAVVGSVYMRVGGRIATLDRHGDNQLDELLVRYRNRHVGDIQVGRFHWFPGPVSNGQLGRLISFTSSDGVLWDVPGTGSAGLQLAWFDKINPLAGPRVGGYSGRLTLPVRTGQIAFTALSTSQKTVGATTDLVYPILPQKLEIYGEGGVDTAHQTIYSAGLYFPELFHSFRADLALEWSYRGHFAHSFDLALHLPLGRHVATLITLAKPGASSWRPGIGLQARY
jgi:hypothetical protein